MRHFHINKSAVNYFLDISFLCRPIWGNATVSAFPHVLIVGGGTAFLQQNIWGNGVLRVSPPLYTTGTENRTVGRMTIAMMVCYHRAERPELN